MNKQVTHLVVIFFLICGINSACAPRNIVGLYSKKLGNTNYYEILNLKPEGTFSYTSNAYMQSNNVPYMPVLTMPPDSIGKGTYILDGNYILLEYTGEGARLPIIEKLSSVAGNGKCQLYFSVIDGGMKDGDGLPITVISRFDNETKAVIDSVLTNFDGKGEISLDQKNFPCYIRVSFLGYKSQTLFIEKPGSYLIQLTLDDKPNVMHGERRYQVLKKEGHLIIAGMKK